jgi:hypothetical protein
VDKVGDKVDWGLVKTQTKTFDWSFAVFSALSRIQSLFNTAIPTGILLNLESNSYGKVGRMVEIKSILQGRACFKKDVSSRL